MGLYPINHPQRRAHSYVGTRQSGFGPERSYTGSGIGNRNFYCRIGMITDGTSNTLLLLEQSSKIAKWDHPTNQFLWCNHNTQGLANALQLRRNFPPNPDPFNQFFTHRWRTTGRPGYGLGGRASWSHHAGGVQVAMCDGSVHFVTDSIALPPWRRLHSRDDGQP